MWERSLERSRRRRDGEGGRSLVSSALADLDGPQLRRCRLGRGDAGPLRPRALGLLAGMRTCEAARRRAGDVAAGAGGRRDARRCGRGRCAPGAGRRPPQPSPVGRDAGPRRAAADGQPRPGGQAGAEAARDRGRRDLRPRHSCRRALLPEARGSRRRRHRRPADARRAAPQRPQPRASSEPGGSFPSRRALGVAGRRSLRSRQPRRGPRLPAEARPRGGRRGRAAHARRARHPPACGREAGAARAREDEAAAAPKASSRGARAATVALRYLGIPYRWGGESPSTGFDCSGFVMYVFSRVGISLPRVVSAQYRVGKPVSRGALRPGRHRLLRRPRPRRHLHRERALRPLAALGGRREDLEHPRLLVLLAVGRRSPRLLIAGRVSAEQGENRWSR